MFEEKGISMFQESNPSEEVFCKECGFPSHTNPCLSCGAVNPNILLENFSPPTWSEISDEFRKRLFIDDEWLTEDVGSLTWWPSYLPQTVFVSEEISIESDGIPDVVTRVTVETEIGQVLDEAGLLKAIREINEDFPFGSFLLIDGVVLAVFSLAFNSRTRSLMTLFCDNAVIQATVAYEASKNLEERGLVKTFNKPHPISGEKSSPDEILDVYANNDFYASYPESTNMHREIIRQSLRNQFLRDGLVKGFENEEVTFFSFDKFDCGIGWRDDLLFAERFGNGLLIWNNLLQSSEPFTDSFINMANCVLAAPQGYGVGHVGSISAGRNGTSHMLKQMSYLSYFVVETTEHGIQGGIMTAINAVHQINASARLIAEELHA